MNRVLFAALVGFCQPIWASRSVSFPSGLLLHAGMDPTFVAQFVLFTACLLLWTVLVGKIFKRFLRLPVIAGQIVAGMMLGPSLINMQRWPIFSSPLTFIDLASDTVYSVASSELFVFFIVLLSSALTVTYLLWTAGHETDIKDIIKVGLTATSAGVLGALLPIVVIAGTLYYAFGGWFSLVAALSMGLVFAATSVSIPVAMLFAQNKMHLKSSRATLGAAVIDDIVAVVLLSLFLMILQSGAFGAGFSGTTHAADVWSALFAMCGTLVALLAFGYLVIVPAIKYLNRPSYTYLVAPVATGVMLLYFSGSELLGGLAGITGAYFAGLFHRMGDVRHRAEKTLIPFVNAVLLPLFLGSIGLYLNVSILSPYQWGMVALLLALAIVSKFAGCYLATGLSNLVGRRKANRWSLLEGYLFGSSMVARGEVGLVISTILHGAGCLDPQQYVLCVVTIVLTTIAAPILLAIGFAVEERPGYELPDEEFSLDLGAFNILGTTQMFNIIANCIGSRRPSRTTVRFSEGRKILNLEGENVKIILCPQAGILFKGDRVRIAEILRLVRNMTYADLERLPDL